MTIDDTGSELKVGAKMEDGTIYAGVSPDTGEAMYAAPADLSLKKLFNKRKNKMSLEEAKKQAKELSRKTGDNYRVPSAAELQVLFNNRAAIGGFNEAANTVDSCYRSSTPVIDVGTMVGTIDKSVIHAGYKYDPMGYAIIHNFNSEKQFEGIVDAEAPVRLIKSKWANIAPIVRLPKNAKLSYSER